MPDSALRAVFQATVESKMSYAASAWWGYTSAADRGRLEAFLRRSVSFGYRDASTPSFALICAQAVEKLFNKILQDERHLLRTLLPFRKKSTLLATPTPSQLTTACPHTSPQ
jgi:hypothetical protein